MLFVTKTQIRIQLSSFNKKDINFYCKSYNRLDPSILLVDPQNNCILEESFRIGINTKLYEKNKWENCKKNVSVSHLKK